MPIILAKLQFFKRFMARPAMVLWLLACLATASGLFAAWGLLHVTSLSAKSETRDDRATTVAINLKEELASYSKLTYDFLLQQDFSKMMTKEKESNAARTAIDQNLNELAGIDPNSSAHSAIEAIRTNVAQFLTLTDKALETAAEDGSATKARNFLQDQVEPAYKNAEEAVNQLLSSRDQFDVTRFKRMREQALMVIAALVGMTALGVVLLLSLRSHILHGVIIRGEEAAIVPEDKKDPVNALSAMQSLMEEPLEVEARSLATLAFANRLSRVRKECDDLRKLVQGLAGFVPTQNAPVELPPNVRSNTQDMETLTRQGDKISHAVGRIQHIHDQSKQFIDKLNEMMNSVQKLATDGNVVALNVTIELAKLQAQAGGVHEEKNKFVSEQIRGLATSAASITGKLAMVLSQFRYTQEDFARHTGELMELRSAGTDALGRVREALETTGQSATRLTERRDELTEYLPNLEQKMGELENQISQLQSIYTADIETLGDGISQRSFKVISGGIAS
jgi:cell division protein ZapA (FtsZ GTPase activity inhibitor)